MESEFQYITSHVLPETKLRFAITCPSEEIAVQQLARFRDAGIHAMLQRSAFADFEIVVTGVQDGANS